ncbi:hypothetical protein pb186bvf_016246 [Paramecium bursaria]
MEQFTNNRVLSRKSFKRILSQTQCQSIGDETSQGIHTCTQDILTKNNEQMKSLNYQDYFFLDQEYETVFLEISPNEEMLAFGGYRNNKLTILNILTKTVMKEIQFDLNIWKCRFSDDSNFIFFGDQIGQLYQFNIQKDFQLICATKVHSSWFNDIKIINNEQVVSCSNEKQIIVTDLKNKQQLLNISHFHKGDINQLEYDSLKNIMISCSDDKSIKFFQMNGNLFINQQNAHNDSIFQVQLINNNRNLLSRTDKQFKKGKIDYYKRALKQTKTQIEKDSLYSFYFAQNDQILIKMYSKYLLILDKQFKVIKKYKHKIKDFFCAFYSNQPVSLNYLLIQGSQGLQVFKRVQ